MKGKSLEDIGEFGLIEMIKKNLILKITLLLLVLEMIVLLFSNQKMIIL